MCLAALSEVLLLALFNGQPSIAVRKVCDIEGASGYNEWLSSHAADFPGLSPIYITVAKRDRSEDSTAVKYQVQFWDADGSPGRRVDVTGRPCVSVFPDGDRVAICQVGRGKDPARKSLKVLNHTGKEILTFDEGSVVPSFNINTSPLLYQVPLGAGGMPSGSELVVYGPEGQVVLRRQEPAAACLSHGIAWSADTTCVLRLGLGAHKVLVVSTDDGVLWEKSYPDRVSTAISRDGSRIAVQCRMAIQVFDRSGRIVAAFDSDAPAGRLAFTDDGDRLLAARKAAVQAFNVHERRRLWSRVLPESGIGGHPRALRLLSDIAVLAYGSNNVYFLDPGTGEDIRSPFDLGLGESTIPGRTRNGSVIWRTGPFTEWTCDITRNSLLVKIGDRRIVYEFGRVK